MWLLAGWGRGFPGWWVGAEAIRMAGCEADAVGVGKTKRVQMGVGGRDVVIVEYSVGTGMTLSYLSAQLLARNPGTLVVCALLDRESNRGSAKNQFVAG